VQLLDQYREQYGELCGKLGDDGMS
jgi:hypothetical protein